MIFVMYIVVAYMHIIYIYCIPYIIGCQAIFLIGKSSKSIKPDAVCLNSGDVCIMSGEARLSFHGVAKILEDKNNLLDKCFWYDEDDNYLFKKTMADDNECYVDDKEWQIGFWKYIKCNRINLNIRQVF